MTCPDTLLAARMARSAEATRAAMERAGMVDGPTPRRNAKRPPGRARLPATEQARGLLRDGRSIAEVHRATHLSCAHLRRLRRSLMEAGHG